MAKAPRGRFTRDSCWGLDPGLSNKNRRFTGRNVVFAAVNMSVSPVEMRCLPLKRCFYQKKWVDPTKMDNINQLQAWKCWFNIKAHKVSSNINFGGANHHDVCDGWCCFISKSWLSWAVIKLLMSIVRFSQLFRFLDFLQLLLTIVYFRCSFAGRQLLSEWMMYQPASNVSRLQPSSGSRRKTWDTLGTLM